MKSIKFIIILSVLFSFGACNYLDIMPDEVATEEDAFENSKAAERYLYSCYSYIPKLNSGVESLDFMTADEVITVFDHETFANFPKGNYTASNPVISYWDKLYLGIRQCYLLLENIDGVPRMTAENLKSYKAEAKFLIAYYHHLLMKCYGPTTLMERNYAITSSASEWPERATYDRCVEWVDSMYLEAAKDLPPLRYSTAYGRATSVAAKALRSRLRLYAASPLFNGDQRGFYANLKNSKGENLISQTYDGKKWEAAAKAAKEAIDWAEGEGYILYEDASSTSVYQKPTDHTERSLRLNFINAQNSNEVLWADTRMEGYYDLQNKSTPWYTQAEASFNGICPTLRMVEYFYTENGLPIDQDKNYDYNNRYGYKEYHITNKVDGVTMNLNVSREPRFYSWISFHNGYYEIARAEGGQMITQYRSQDNCGIQGRHNNYSPGGYLNKKGVSPAYSNTSLAIPTGYPWPVIRLAELYLNYAEALIEQPNPDLATARIYIDKVRNRAGLDKIEVSWAADKINSNGWNYNTVDGMREIVRGERTIELYLENQRFWDLRRWGIADQFLNESPKGLNVSESTDAGFFQVKTLSFARNFEIPVHFLMPIPSTEIDKVEGVIVQNPGY